LQNKQSHFFPFRSKSAPIKKKTTAPIKPNKTPQSLRLMNITPKNKTPNKKVKSGVNEFKIPANELLICVCANGNKKAGIAFPNIEKANIYLNFLLETFLNALFINGKKANIAKVIRKAATSCHEKANKLRLIKKKELPQSIDKNINVAYARNLLFVSIFV
jgi:hypothetical protein